MYHLRVPVFLLAALVLLHCIAAAPNHRYFSSSDDEQENALPVKESRSLPRLISNPMGPENGPMGPWLRSGFAAISSNRLKLKKEKLAKNS